MPTDHLRIALQRVRRRLTLAAVLERAAALLVWTFATGIAYAIVTKLAHALPPADRVGLWLMVAAAVSAVVWTLTRRPTLMDAATASDGALGLKERLSSAYLLESRSAEDPMVAALVADAEARAASLDPRKAYPTRWPRRSRGAALTGVLFLAVLLVPQMSWLLKPEQKALRTEEKRQSKKLKQVAKRIERVRHKETEADRKQLARRLKALAKEMKRGELSKVEALKQYRQLTKEAEELHQKLAQQNSLKPTAQALTSLKNALSPGQSAAPLPEGVRQALKDLMNKLDRGQLSPEQQKRLAEALKKAAEALKKAGNAEAAKALSEAAKCLSSGNCSGAAAALSEALSGLEGALSALDAEALSEEALAELMDGRLDLALADDTCPSCGNPSALCTCDNCGFG
jgi:DNA repair exonuclease SbcCD ATPase subunit